MEKYSATILKWFPRRERLENRRFWKSEKEEIFDALKAGGCRNISNPEIEVVNNCVSMRIEFTADERPDLEGMHTVIKKIPHAYGHSEGSIIFGKWDADEQMFAVLAVRGVNYDVSNKGGITNVKN